VNVLLVYPPIDYTGYTKYIRRCRRRGRYSGNAL